jgi:predicted metal-dependent hydrolase
MNDESFSKTERQFEDGILAFSHSEFYEAHEHFEDAWRVTPGPSREFYRALIQISGGFFRLTQGRKMAANKFFQHALHWLEGFQNTTLNVNISALKTNINAILTSIESPLSADDIIDRHLALFIRTLEPKEC